MVIVGSVIYPHGTMIFDGNPNVADGTPTAERIKAISVTQRQDCRVLFTSCSKAAEIAKQTSPDVIFFNTPHGICLRDAVGVYLNSTAKGNAEWNRRWNEYEVDIKLDVNLSSKLVDHLHGNGIAAEGITAIESMFDMPLQWGEVIPMWFLQDLMSVRGKEAKVVIFTNPVNKVKGPTPLASAANIGRSIATFLRGLDQRVLYVVTGDLAHNHKTDCQNELYLPDPQWTFTSSPIALHFDVCVENWIKGVSFTPKEEKRELIQKSTNEYTIRWDAAIANDAEQWLSKAIALQSPNYSCGIFGFGVLHGVLLAEIEQGTRFTSHFLCRLAPTYYGMMVAAIIRDT